MSLISPCQSLCTASSLLEITKWRNRPSPLVVDLSKRLVSEVGYVLIALSGVVEGVARIVFASIAYLVSELPLDNSVYLKENIVKPLREGIDLNFGCSLIAFLALGYNPFQKNLSLDHLRQIL